MKRTALSVAVLFALASAVVYFGKIKYALIFGAVLLTAAAVILIFKDKFKTGYKPIATLALGAVFCIYACLFYYFKVVKVNEITGQEILLNCIVKEEPDVSEKYTRVLVSSLKGNQGIQPGTKFYINVPNDKFEFLEVGDTLKVFIKLEELPGPIKHERYSKGVYAGAFLKSLEKTGHEKSLYEYAVKIRQKTRKAIEDNTDGKGRAVLKGLILGDTKEMRGTLYEQFKAGGVCHIVAVSGMHISVFALLVLSILKRFTGFRTASALSVMPVILAVAVTGMTPSAVRAGIMCIILLIGNALLCKTDGMNSLGVSAAALMIANPFYILSLSFQLSCCATAGVILASDYGTKTGNKIIRLKTVWLSSLLKNIILTFIQSLGAVIFTLPIQIIAFGKVSLIAPVTGVFVNTAAVFAMVAALMGSVFTAVPFLKILVPVTFAIGEIFAEYIVIIVKMLSSFAFSYISFGSGSAVIWLTCSIILTVVWFLMHKPFRKEILALNLSALMIISLWSWNISSKSVVEVASLNVGEGFCTIISYDKNCVIIGCGDDYYDKYAVKEHLKIRGITKVSALLIPSSNKVCFGGFNGFIREFSPDAVIASNNIENYKELPEDTLFGNDGSTYKTQTGEINITQWDSQYGCIYELVCYGKRFAISCSACDLSQFGLSNADFHFKTTAVCENSNAPIKIVSCGNNYIGEDKSKSYKIYKTDRSTISVKLKKGKGFTVYAG